MSNRQQLPVGVDLLVFTLSRCHALELLHPLTRRPFAVGKMRNVFGNDLVQASNQPGQNPDRVPEQRGIGGPMDIGFHNRRIGTQLLAIFQTVIDGSSNNGVIKCFYGGRTQPVERLVECIVPGNRLAVKAGKLPQRVSVIDAFTQFAVVPILDTHQDQRTENLVWC